MFVYNIWDVLVVAIIETIIEALPVIGIIFLCCLGAGALAFGLHYLDCKYWHTKEWPLWKQIICAIISILIVLFIGFIILLIVCTLNCP